MRRLLPIGSKDRATVNYSMLSQFKPANIFRFFCLSLRRDEYYYVHTTLEELKRTTGDKSLNDFNKQFKEFLNIKPYYEDNGFVFKTRRNIYRVPPMEPECVTFSNNIIWIDLEAAHIGFFMQLFLFPSSPILN